MTDLNEASKMLYVMGGVFAIGSTVIGGLLIWGIQKFLTTAFNLVIEMKLLRQEMAEVKSYGARIMKLEKDVSEAHSKIRVLKNNEGDL
jgi:hypothetical protein